MMDDFIYGEPHHLTTPERWILCASLCWLTTTQRRRGWETSHRKLIYRVYFKVERHVENYQRCFVRKGNYSAIGRSSFRSMD
jgi:hypothetical protein